MKVYVSGVVSKGGTLSEHERRKNMRRFYDEAERLRSLGHEPVNPLEVNSAMNGGTWLDAMRADIKTLMDCDAISLLEGWQDSRGARIEYNLAIDLGLMVFDQEADA